MEISNKMKNEMITVYYNKKKFTVSIEKEYINFVKNILEINNLNEYNYSKMLILFKVNQGEIKQLIDQASYELFLDYSDLIITIKELHQVLYYIDKQQQIQLQLKSLSNDTHHTHLLPEANLSDVSKVDLSIIKDEIVNSLSNEINQMKKELLSQVSQVSNTQLSSKTNMDSHNKIHKGITCSICGVNPIKGIRYHCLNCSQFELCETCEEKMGEIHSHALLKIRLPRTRPQNQMHSIDNSISNNNKPGIKEKKYNPVKISEMNDNKIDEMNFYNI